MWIIHIRLCYKESKRFLAQKKTEINSRFEKKIKSVVLFLPVREIMWGEKEEYMVFLYEMLIATEMRKSISIISDNISFSIGKINEYNHLDNMFFFGGFNSHRYVEVLFKNFAKEGKVYFSTREKTYNNLKDEEKVLYKVIPNHANPYRYIRWKRE